MSTENESQLGAGVTVTAEQTEAYGLGATLATISTTLRFVSGTVTKMDNSLDGALRELGMMRVDVGRHDEQIRTLFAWKLAQEGTVTPDYATKTDVSELRTELAGNRLTWPKLLAGFSALGGVAIAGCALLLTVANNLGLFDR